MGYVVLLLFQTWPLGLELSASGAPEIRKSPASEGLIAMTLSREAWDSRKTTGICKVRLQQVDPFLKSARSTAPERYFDRLLVYTIGLGHRKLGVNTCGTALAFASSYASPSARSVPAFADLKLLSTLFGCHSCTYPVFELYALDVRLSSHNYSSTKA